MLFRVSHQKKGKIVFKDRTTATVIILAVIALIIMVVGLFASSQNDAAIAQQTADAQTALAPTYDALTQTAADRQATQSILNVTATQVATEAFATDVALATNAVGSDVQTTASGLQYRVVVEGTGPKPTASDTVTVDYRGILPDGTEFDSSFKRGQPATFAVNQVIAGWTEGLQLMPVGSTYIFTIPPDLGYGANSPTPLIPPNSTLIFQVDLLSIQPASGG